MKEMLEKSLAVAAQETREIRRDRNRMENRLQREKDNYRKNV